MNIQIAVYGETSDAQIVAAALKKFLNDFAPKMEIRLIQDDVVDPEFLQKLNSPSEVMQKLCTIGDTLKVELTSHRVNNIYHVVPAKADTHRKDVS